MCIHEAQEVKRRLTAARATDRMAAELSLKDSHGDLIAAVIVQDASEDVLVLAAIDDLKHWHATDIERNPGCYFDLTSVNFTRDSCGYGNWQDQGDNFKHLTPTNPPTTRKASMDNHTDDDEEFARQYREAQLKVLERSRRK